MHPTVKSILAAVTFAAAAALALASPAAAHADADVVAVAAGEQVTISFRPNHGCGDSPTTEIAVRSPLSGVVGEDVEGWTTTSTDDGEGRTVTEWTGGSLPPDETGAFPITFTAPDQVGELLLFPSVQVCENGEDYAWINGDPESNTPAPRLLILAPGSAAAVSIDEVPDDAPGRELLTAVIDTGTTPTTAPTTTTTAGTDVDDTTETTTSASATSSPSSSAQESDTGTGGSNAIAIVLVGGVALGLAAGAIYLWKKER